MSDKEKQKAPRQFRPYKPVGELLDNDQQEYERENGKGTFNLNHRLNQAVYVLYGRNPETLEGYRREKK